MGKWGGRRASWVFVIGASASFSLGQVGYVAKLETFRDPNNGSGTSFYNAKYRAKSDFLISDDWSIIAGTTSSNFGTSSYRGFAWTRSGGMVNLGQLGDQGSGVTSMSADGSKIYGLSQAPGLGAQHLVTWTPAYSMVDVTQIAGGATGYGSDGKSAFGVAVSGGNNVFFHNDASSTTLSNTLPGSGANLSYAMMSGDNHVMFGRYINGANQQSVRWDGTTTAVDMGSFGGNDTTVEASSADGSVAVGYSKDATNIYYQAFKYVQGFGMGTIIPSNLTSYNRSVATYVSPDGSTIIGQSEYNNTGNRIFWSGNWAGFQDIGNLGSGNSFVYKVADNGNTILGTSSTASFSPRAFRWTISGGTVDLGITGMSSLSFQGTSDDGVISILGGKTTGNVNKLYRVVGTTVTDLGQLDSSAIFVDKLSADGSKMVVSNSSKSYFWSQPTGFKSLGIVDGVQISSDTAVSPNFDLIGGSVTVGGVKTAYIWSNQLGAFDLKNLLIANGANMTGWDALNTVQVIDDVNGVAYVTGIGTFNGQTSVKYFAAVPEPASIAALVFGLGFLSRKKRSRSA